MERLRNRSRLGLAAVLVIALSARSSGAQLPRVDSGRLTAVQAQVHDSAGGAITGAEVAIVRGLNDVRGSAVTDQRGHISMRVERQAPTDSADAYELVVRKIGYQRTDRFVSLVRDSINFDVVLERSIQSMAPVVVSAEQTIRQKSYHIDADQIANSDRLLLNTADILAKLRPDMICGRSCSPMASIGARTQTGARKCPMLAFHQRAVCPPSTAEPSLETNVWVNGRRIRLVPLDEVALARQTGVLAGLKPGTMTVLSEIKPEHIAEMTYADEFDTSVGKNGSNDALFIVLKPGVVYEPGRASFVENAQLQSDTGVTSPVSVAPLPIYRCRLLGVFDAATGDALGDAIVTDMNTGSYVRTGREGTISLVFLPEGTTPIRITHAGYADLELPVEIGPATPTGLTLLLERRAAPDTTSSAAPLAH